MAKKTIEICGEVFELSNKTANFYEVVNSFRHDGRRLCDCYANPSQYKQEIYDYWCEWFYYASRLNRVDYEYDFKFGVSGYNCNTFSISALVKFDGEWYSIFITKAHNRATRLVFN